MSNSTPKPVPTAPVPSAPSLQRGKWHWLWLTLGLGGVALVSASAGALLAVSMTSTPLSQRKLDAKDAKAFNQTDISTGFNLRLPQLTRPVNILVLGTKVLTSDVDTPPTELTNLSYDALVNSLDGLTDSMVMIRFEPTTHQVVVLSLPRDTRTWIEGGGLTKLNEANALGGPALAARSTSELLGGVGIDRYIRINIQGVEKLIDALGGVKVYVPQDMEYKDDTQHLYISLKKGEQHLNGSQAVQFLRFRYDAYGDIGRVQRQQMFMRALLEQTLKPATLTHLPQILSVIQSNIDTNLSVEELIALAGFASQTDRSRTKMLMLPGSFSGTGEYEASYWLPNQAAIGKIVSQYFGVTPTFANPEVAEAEAIDVASPAVQVAIQDSTGQADLPEKLMAELGKAGYGNVFVDQAWSEPLAVTQIIAQHGDTASAEAVHQVLGYGEVRVESTGNLDSDVTIRIGQDALKAPVHASPAPAPTSTPVPEATSVSTPVSPEATPPI